MHELPHDLLDAFRKLGESGKAVGDQPLVVGGFVRDWLIGVPIEEIRDFDVISRKGRIEDILQDFSRRFGLGEPIVYEYTGTKKIVCNGYNFEFQSVDNPNVHFPVEDEMQRMGVPVTFLNKNIYERDFTIDTMCYDVIDEKFLDITGEGYEDLIKRKVIRTPIPAKRAIEFNPFIILRMMRFHLEFDLEISEELKEALPEGVKLLPKATADRSERFVKDLVRDIFDIDSEKADKLFREYNLYNLIPVPQEIFDQSIKRQMGIKYMASSSIQCNLDKVSNRAQLCLVQQDLRDDQIKERVQESLSELYMQGAIDKQTKISLLDGSLGTIASVVNRLNARESKSWYKEAYNNTHMYERIQRRKEYRNRKRREQRRDRISKIKFWKDFQRTFASIDRFVAERNRRLIK